MPRIYGNSEIWGDLLVTGSFSVLGSASTINTSSLVVSDTIIALGHSQSGSPILDEGIMFVRGTGLTQAFIWDESDDTFAFIGTNDDHTVVGDINIDSYSNLRVGGLTTSTIKIINGAASGYILQSDASGNATWVSATSGSANFANTNLTLTGSRTHTIPSSNTLYLGQSSYVGPYLYLGGTNSGFSSDYTLLGYSNNFIDIDNDHIINWFGSVNRLSILSSEIVINETGGNYDFRVEGDTDANLFFVDASTDTIGIGSAAVSTVKTYINSDKDYTLTVQNTKLNSTVLQVLQSGTGSATGIQLSVTGVGSSNTGMIIDTSGSSTNRAIVVNSGDVIFNNGSGNYDFRVKGDTDSSLFFVDASTDNIGIGTQTPQSASRLQIIDNQTKTQKYSLWIETTGDGISDTNVGQYILVSGGNNFNYGQSIVMGGTYGSIVNYGSYIISTANVPSQFGLRVNISSGDQVYGVSSETSGSGSIRYAYQGVLAGTASTKHGLNIYSSGGNNTTYGSYIELTDSGSNNYGVWVDSYNATNNYGILVNRGTSIFNEFGGDYDFRIEGDNDQNLFFADASTDNIGIGNNSPSYKLQVSGTTSTTGFRMTNGATNGYVLTSDASGNATWQSPSGAVNIYSTTQSFTGGVTYSINHGLSTNNILVNVWDDLTGELIGVDAIRTSSNVVDLNSTVTLSSGRIVIMGG